jgi:hypothetical protein
MRVTGLRGVGKTVLLGAFADRAAEANWEPAELEFQPSHNTNEALQDTLTALLRRTQERLSCFERLRAAVGRALRAGGGLSVTWEDVSLSLSPGSERESDLAREIFETVELAVAKGREGVVLLLDEAQLIRDERGRHGERPLSLLWGSELWDAADLAGVDRLSKELLDEARPEIYQRLDRDFYEPRVSTLTPAEQDVLLVSASCPYPPLRAPSTGSVKASTNTRPRSSATSCCAAEDRRRSPPATST